MSTDEKREDAKKPRNERTRARKNLTMHEVREDSKMKKIRKKYHSTPFFASSSFFELFKLTNTHSKFTLEAKNDINFH